MSAAPAASESGAFMDNLRQLFAECDLDGSGALGRDEFKELCGKLGLSRQLAEETFNRLDIDRNGHVTFDEFAAGFQQYKQTSTTSSPSAAPQLSPSPSTSFRTANGSLRLQATPSPVSVRARSRGSPVVPATLSNGGLQAVGGSSGNLTASGRSTSSGGTSSVQYDLSSSYDLNSSCDLPLQQSHSANDLLAGPTARLGVEGQIGAGGGVAPTSSRQEDDVIVYSSEAIGHTNNGTNSNYGSGQFGSLLSSSSRSYSEVKTMQDLLECVQKLQNENQILTQIFFKDKREREEYISQLGEEFDHQLREVEERANRRAKEELESEKKRLRDMMQTERETLEHHYQTLEKISKIVKGPQGGLDSKGGLEVDEGLFKVKSQLEDTFNENRQLKKSLLDTKTDVAMIWKEMEKLKKQYEVKLTSAYEKQRETQHECDHIKKQLNLMQDSNRKLQDASDVITNYITDKVEPVIKVALDGAGGDDYASLNSGQLKLPAGVASAANSRRGSILSEYLMSNDGQERGGDEEDDKVSSSAGDLESMASSFGGGGGGASRVSPAGSNGLASPAPTSANEKSIAQLGRGEQFLSVPKANQKQQQQQVETNLRGSKSALELAQKGAKAQTQQANRVDSSTKGDQKEQEAVTQQLEATQQQQQQQQQAATTATTNGGPASRGGLRSLGRHFMLGARTLSETKASGPTNTAAPTVAEAKAKLAETKAASLDQAQEGPSVEAADGPSVATFNIILVGDSFVGKSSFAARFIEGSFVQGLISNCSIDFKTKSYKVDGINYTVNLWDTAGQERFRSITASYFRKADGIILMYDVTDKRSYLNVRNWMSTISDTAAENVAVLLVGNKIDLRHNDNKAKCVPTEEGLRLAREYDIVFLETSVKTGTNLLPSMGKLIRLIAKNNLAEEEDTDRIRLSDKNRTFNCMPKNC